MAEEEKKKRWRPSLTAYRALEAKVAEYESCKDLKKLKDDYDLLRNRFNDLAEKKKLMADDFKEREEKMTIEKNALEKSNGLLEKEIKRLRELVEGYDRDIINLKAENARLKNRTFWQRLFNK